MSPIHPEKLQSKTFSVGLSIEERARVFFSCDRNRKRLLQAASIQEISVDAPVPAVWVSSRFSGLFVPHIDIVNSGTMTGGPVFPGL